MVDHQKLFVIVSLQQFPQAATSIEHLMDRIRKLFLRNAAPEEAHEPPLRTGVFRRRRNSSKTSKRTQDSTESGVRRSRNKSQGGKHTNRRSRGGSISHNKKFLKNIGAKTKERVRKVRTLTDSRIHGSKPSELVRKSVENRSQSKCSNSRRKAVHPETAEKRRRAKYGKVSETKVEDFTKFETVSAAARPAVSKNLARAKRKHKHSNRNEQRGAEGSVAKEMENSLMTSTPKSQTGSGWTITEEQTKLTEAVNIRAIRQEKLRHLAIVNWLRQKRRDHPCLMKKANLSLMPLKSILKIAHSSMDNWNAVKLEV
ncbi:hypothetical protein RB195_018111 [Necator americanus]|uniref:Uncharacterized protein n=1 Tax=Necator americanus TaxID=51031 RepID=A0ABR1CA92_NECAM